MVLRRGDMTGLAVQKILIIEDEPSVTRPFL